MDSILQIKMQISERFQEFSRYFHVQDSSELNNNQSLMCVCVCVSICVHVARNVMNFLKSKSIIKVNHKMLKLRAWLNNKGKER